MKKYRFNVKNIRWPDINLAISGLSFRWSTHISRLNPLLKQSLHYNTFTSKLYIIKSLLLSHLFQVDLYTKMINGLVDVANNFVYSSMNFKFVTTL